MTNQHVSFANMLICFLFVSQVDAVDVITITGGRFRPFDLKKDQKAVSIKKFQIDKYPVTVGEFAQFLAAKPEWQKVNVPTIKADPGYLQSTRMASGDTKTVMTQVSWYAARAYCAYQKKRLPTLYEWEYVATYNKWDTRPDTNQKILAWFSRPNVQGASGDIGSGLASPQGVRDLHGLIWEWVDDFNSSTVTGDARADTNSESNLFCGAASLAGSDLRNYATYMRYGMRSSLKGNYTGHNLGFRCAKDTQ
ncbi:MAG: formylglycine-generating enzyme family protein [Spirochaetes bacterium]|nr:formylglycine-generating enzyme family protein [Spirochaetota bacterium]